MKKFVGIIIEYCNHNHFIIMPRYFHGTLFKVVKARLLTTFTSEIFHGNKKYSIQFAEHFLPRIFVR